jgi:hypothetical protein
MAAVNNRAAVFASGVMAPIVSNTGQKSEIMVLRVVS